MRRPLALMDRVVWAVTGTVAGLGGLQALTAFVALRIQEDDLAKKMLDREVQQLVAHTAEPGLTSTGSLIDADHLSAWLVRGTQGTAGVPAAYRGLLPGEYQLNPVGKTIHVAVTDTADGRLVVALDATQFERRVVAYGWTLVALLLSSIGVTIFIARRVAAIAVEPVVAVTREIITLLGEEEPDAAAGSTEVTMLMDTFNRFQEKSIRTLAREREFAANLNHEIRTPLTAARTDIEMLSLEAKLASAPLECVNRMMRAVDDIAAAVEAALTFRTSTVPQVIELQAEVRAACAMVTERSTAMGLHIQIMLPPSLQVHGDRQALLSIIHILLRNAEQHAAPATLTVHGDHSRLVFSDDGPGIPADRLGLLFDRRGADKSERLSKAADKVSGERGLVIARMICRTQGWSLTASSEGGLSQATAFIVDFEPGAHGQLASRVGGPVSSF